MFRLQAGFSLLELVVVIILIALLMVFVIDRVLRLQIDAERISIQHMTGTLDSAVYLHAAELVVKQGLGALRNMENTNPMNYLEKLPHNYAGEASDVLSDQLAPSRWYYDSADNILFYIVRNTDYFSTDLSGTPRIRLKLSLLYADNRTTTRLSNIRGVVLKSPDTYSWKTVIE